MQASDQVGFQIERDPTELLERFAARFALLEAVSEAVQKDAEHEWEPETHPPLRADIAAAILDLADDLQAVRDAVARWPAGKHADNRPRKQIDS